MANRTHGQAVRRRAALVVGVGAVTLIGAGCHTVEPIPVHGDRSTTVRYHGVKPTAEPISPVAAVATQPLASSRTPAPEVAIDLGAALRLAGVDNPTVNLARERVQEALADQLAARSLLLPSVNAGGNFYLHRGALQTSAGQVRDVDRQGLYLGAGARAAGAGTVTVPGVWLFAHLGDAAYEPQAARQRVIARGSDAQAVQNAILRDVAALYLQLVGADARLAVLRQGESDLADVVRLTRVYAEKGQGRRADADRATANAELLNRQVREAEEDVAVAAARLCRLLNLDPATRLRTPGGAVQPLRLIPEDTEIETLVAEAVRARPEVLARAAEIQEAQARVRQERVRPWLPLVSVGYSGGAFGGGGNLAASDFGPLAARTNFDVAAVWNFENLGFGNRARTLRASAAVGQAVAGYDLAVNQARREVAEALAEAKAAARQTEAVRPALEAAEEGYRLETERIRQGLGRPIEALDSFRQLLDSRQELVRAVVAYDVAQFRLFAAVGNDPSAVTPGERPPSRTGPGPGAR